MRPHFLVRITAVLTALGIISGWFFICPPKTQAANQTPEIVINEVFWMGSHLSTADEWLEFYNPGIEEVSLANWSVWRLNSGEERQMFAFPAQAMILPSEHYLVANYSASHANSALAIEPDYVTTSVSLSNSAFHLTLKNSIGEVVDEAGDGDEPVGGEYVSGQTWASMERNPELGSGTLAESWHASLESVGFDAPNLEMGTPGSENSEANHPPRAVIETEYKEGPAPQTVKFFGDRSSDADGDALTYLWDFGDGEISEEINPEHNYQTKGEYEVALVVADPFEEVETSENIIVTNAAPEIKRVYGDTELIIPTDSQANFYAIVNDNDGQTDIAEVKGEILGEIIILSDNGEGIDEIAGDKTYSATWNLPENLVSGEQQLIYTTTDLDGETDSAVLNIKISALAINGVRFSEILPNPEGDDKTGEFVEIVNESDSERDLNKWKIIDQSGREAILPETKLAAHSYAVFYSNQTKLTVNNTEEALSLYTPEGKLVDQTNFQNAPNGEAWIFSDGAWQWSSFPTPGSPNVKNEINDPSEPDEENNNEDEKNIETPKETEAKQISESEAQAITISEIYPNPRDSKTEDEWVELFNSENHAISLAGLILDDQEKGSSPYRFSEADVIPAQTYKVFSKEKTKLALNNSGDSARLLFNDGREKENIIYQENAPKGASLAKFSAGWQWTGKPTPNAGNVLAADVQTESKNSAQENLAFQTIVEAKNQPKNTVVKVQGVISAVGLASASDVYIQDQTGGLKLTFSSQMPTLKTGNEIEATGKISERDNEKHLLIKNQSDIKIVNEQKPIVPSLRQTGKITESDEGALILVSGKISRKITSGFYLDDGSGEVKISTQKNSFNEKDFIGNQLEVVGVISENKSGRRVLAQKINSQEAASIENSVSASLLASDVTSEPLLKNSGLVLGVVGLIVIFGVYGFWHEKKRKNALKP